MTYEATSKYMRISTRKVRLVTDAVKTHSVTEAIAQLSIMPKRAAGFLKKTIDSAVANAKQKNAAVDQLAIVRIEVMGGPVMKRFHAVSRGMAHSYKKRMTHIKVVLTDEAIMPAVKKDEDKIVKGGQG